MLRLPAAVLVAVVCGILLPHAAVAGSADPLDGLIVREVRVTGLRNLEPAAVTRHLATRAGQPFHQATADLDRRRLDELRLFSAVAIRPELDAGAVVVTVAVSETLRLLPTILIRVTDENGLSGGVGMRGLNLLGGGSQTGVGVMFGGETSVSAQVDSTTITPGTWYRHLAFGYSSRSNAVYDFEEKSTTTEFRFARNFAHGLRAGGLTSLLSIDAGTSGAALSADGSDLVPTLGGFVTLDTLDSSTNPRRGTWAEVEFDRLTVDASSWTVILDGRRFQPLSERHGLGLFSLATFQTGEVGVDLPEYLQFALGGGNTVRGWGLGTRKGRNQFIGTAEYSFVARPVTPFSVFGINAYAGLQIVAFADVGMAWNNSTDFRAGDAIDGYGAGVRVLVPFVDLIRIDVGWGEPGRGATAYFGISLKPTRQRQRVR
ncbi:MAG TPA: BamA/TamA family outer membrane protein [Vicinamibacterales bacterium]|nr:BamA/TamA family outer membrane protein [Vicinamibacterales bacterium]